MFNYVTPVDNLRILLSKVNTSLEDAMSNPMASVDEINILRSERIALAAAIIANTI